MNVMYGIIEYESILLGKANSFSTTYIGKDATEKDVLPIFRYVFEEILNWTPQDIQHKLTIDLLKKLKLYRIYRKINYPSGLSLEKDVFFLAYKLYPKEVGFTKKDIILYIYEKTLQGERKKLPKGFFDYSSGSFNASLCLQHVILKNPFRSTKEMYMFFANKTKADSFLKENRLLNFCNLTYEYPIDFLEESLPEMDKDEFYYYYGRFCTELEKMETLRKGKKNED